MIPGVKGKMAGNLASGVHMLHGLEGSLTIVDGENHHAVIATIGGIQEPAGRIDCHGGRGTQSAEAFREGGDAVAEVE